MPDRKQDLVPDRKQELEPDRKQELEPDHKLVLVHNLVGPIHKEQAIRKLVVDRSPVAGHKMVSEELADLELVLELASIQLAEIAAEL